ncbi:MAG: hypothetical protein K9M07_07455 [Simkaniaceae bacterium]|nr:hypothetical protein [Simkaniaceae bacterium]
MSKKKITILGTGSYLPAEKITHEILEERLGLEKGWIMERCGVETRYYAAGEDASSMGTKAALQAIEAAGLSLEEIDVIIGVSGVPQQAIPSMGALIHKQLGLKKSFAFDVNSTCLSFLLGLDIAADLIEGGKARHILLVSADIASVGLNPADPKTATLFGDGATAVVIGKSTGNAGIEASAFESWTEDQEACLLEIGGSKLPYVENLAVGEEYRRYFQMDGPLLFKSAIPRALKMIKDLMEQAQGDVSLMIPHQASPGSLRLIERKLGDFQGRIINIVKDFGNMIATSIPFALHYAIQEGKLKRGDRCLLIGTSAGISIGGMILEY